MRILPLAGGQGLNNSNSIADGMEDMNLKNQLRFYLDLREMSATQLAKKSSVPKQSLAGWIAGSNPRDVRQVKRVADVLGVSLDNLLFGVGRDGGIAAESESCSYAKEDWVSGVFEVRIRKVSLK